MKQCFARAAVIAVLWPTCMASAAPAAAAGRMTSQNGIRRAYRFAWNRLGRKGQWCRVTARGTLNSCRVEFDDGFVMVTSRNALRKEPCPA